MSATLTSCGTFDLFLRQSGLGFFDSPAFLRVESPLTSARTRSSWCRRCARSRRPQSSTRGVK